MARVYVIEVFLPDAKQKWDSQIQQYITILCACVCELKERRMKKKRNERSSKRS